MKTKFNRNLVKQKSFQERIERYLSKYHSTDTDTSNQNKIIEYVATFPNVTVKAGDEYKTCVLPMKTLKLICAEGTNSPGKRPEIVDVDLNSTVQNSQALTISGQHKSISYSSEDDKTNTAKYGKDSKDDERDK